jgi:dienelactone hydrolase
MEHEKMLMIEEKHYLHGDTLLKGWLYYQSDSPHVRPGVLVVHDWSGCNELTKERAKVLAEQGFVAFAIDMYGEGRVGVTNEEKQALMQPVISNRQLLRERMQRAYQLLAELPLVQTDKMVAIGFCFGGLCVLDLARSGAGVAGVVSFHGLLHDDPNFVPEQISADILILHGYNDPMVSPQAVQKFCDEMTRLKANWQVNMYGNTSHAFTNPMANDVELGLIYQPETSEKAFQEMNAFFKRIL